jgi:hypothetical protein
VLPRRQVEISRLEAFSDVVFALALMLRVVSRDVPRSATTLSFSSPVLDAGPRVAPSALATVFAACGVGVPAPAEA